MTNLESSSEKLNTPRKGSLKTERDLSHLKNSTKLSNLKSEIKKSSNAGKFEFKNISRDGKYKVYLYTIKKRGTPSILKYQTVKRGMAESKDQIKITNKDGVEYEESYKFSAGDKVYIKIEIKAQAKLQTKPQEKTQTKPQTKPQAIEIQQSNTGKFEYKNISSDGKFEVYSYIVDQSITTQWKILNKAKKELNLRDNTRGLEITNSKGIQYEPRKTFKVGEKIYLKIPVNIEKNIQIIDGMKRKGGEYFGIDVSRYNDQINLTSFEKRNNEKWESIEKDRRGVSFIYIRAGDGHPNAKTREDKKFVINWTNFVKEHNNDRTIKDQHEQIATGFYWTLTNKKDAITQANDFLKIYNNYKNIPGGNKLVPMIDLETDRFTEVKRRYKNKRGKPIVERYKPQGFKENALKWLQYVEQKTGIIPGLYIGADPYGRYIRGDKRFNKYLTRLTAYPDSDPTTGREIGTARRINFEEGSVKVGPSSKTIDIKPDMYQSSQEGSVDGTSAKVIDGKGKDKSTYHDTDMDHTKDITKLFSKNNKSK